MNQIQELMEKRKLAWEGAKAFVEAKKDKDGLMSDEDAKTYSDMEKKVANFTKEIERMQSMENMEREMAKPLNIMAIPKFITLSLFTMIILKTIIVGYELYELLLIRTRD